MVASYSRGPWFEPLKIVTDYFKKVFFEIDQVGRDKDNYSITGVDELFSPMGLHQLAALVQIVSCVFIGKKKYKLT